MQGILAFCLVLAAWPAAAFEAIPVKSIAQITFDDDGHKLSYPSAVFFDPVEEEIYLVNGGSSRVVVYGPDFFPRVSIGLGRGVRAPLGGTVTPNGEVYICQVSNVRNPRARITILNGAFFVDREIFLDEIPEAANFSPRQVAVNRDGLIYLASTLGRGVLVLDQNGNFLRRLQPTDQLSAWTLANMEASPDVEETTTEPGQEPEKAKEAPSKEDPSFADIPEEFRPKSQQDEKGGSEGGIGPVRINYVTIDSTGKIYLLSAETGKVYVYGPDEKFLYSFGQKGGSPGQLSQPKALAIDEERKLIFVVDYMRQSILGYNMSGTYLFEFGGRGYGPGWFNYPSGIEINRHGQLIVADLFNKRIQVLELDYEGFFPMLGEQQPQAVSLPEGAAAEVPAEADKPRPGSGGIEEMVTPVREIPGYPDSESEVEDAGGDELPGQQGSMDQEIAPEASDQEPTDASTDVLPEKALNGN